jgi:protein phosphatase 1L
MLLPFFPTADAYTHTDSEFLKSENNQNRDAGSTASTAILVGDRLLVANVGDSRAVICRGGNGKASSCMFYSIVNTLLLACNV